jgi:hypothetical protein
MHHDSSNRNIVLYVRVGDNVSVRIAKAVTADFCFQDALVYCSSNPYIGGVGATSRLPLLMHTNQDLSVSRIIIMNDLAVLIPFIIIGIIFFLLLKITLKIRRKGGSLTHIVYGANQEFLTKDQNKAIEVVVNRNANKKEEESGEDKQ